MLLLEETCVLVIAYAGLYDVESVDLSKVCHDLDDVDHGHDSHQVEPIATNLDLDVPD